VISLSGTGRRHPAVGTVYPDRAASASGPVRLDQPDRKVI
jgi:hypothetical protein